MGDVNVRVHRGQMSTVVVFLICVFLCGLVSLLVGVCVCGGYGVVGARRAVLGDDGALPVRT